MVVKNSKHVTIAKLLTTDPDKVIEVSCWFDKDRKLYVIHAFPAEYKDCGGVMMMSTVLLSGEYAPLRGYVVSRFNAKRFAEVCAAQETKVAYMELVAKVCAKNKLSLAPAAEQPPGALPFAAKPADFEADSKKYACPDGAYCGDAACAAEFTKRQAVQ